MADTLLKSKAQLRSISVTSNGTSSTTGDKTPTTPSKLMMNHGKPNFTIQRSPKAQQNGDDNPLTNELHANKNNNYNPYKKAESQSYKSNNNNNILISTKFNGVFQASNVPITQKQPHQNGSDENDNEAAKVVLRRPKAAEPLTQENIEDDNVPEFIKRQRRIQERLAKENVLDFENRRSGYFTHMVITPTSPNRQSLVETMTSPAVMPALEMPAPQPTSPQPQAVMRTMLEETEETAEPSEQQDEAVTTNGHATNGQAEAEAEEEEEVAKAIEEVNKAVAGEDDEKPSEQEETAALDEEEHHTKQVEHVEENVHVHHVEENVHVDHIEEQVHTEHDVDQQAPFEPFVPATSTWHPIEPPTEFKNSQHKEESVDTPTLEQTTEPAVSEHTTPTPDSNGHIEVDVHVEPKQNGHDNDIIISHTNGFDGPSIPAPDPSGVLGVNYEPKTVVSFSKDLSSEPNKYPDTVKVVSENGVAHTPVDEALQDIAKLKFDIKADEQDVHVTPVLRVD